MSAYLTTNKNINYIVKGLYTIDINQSVDFILYRSRKLEEEFARELYNLNVYSLTERYPKNWESMVSPFKWEVIEYTDDFEGRIQLYKSLQAFLYQSCEGNAFETELYKRLREIETKLAKYIITHTPEYDRANWG